MTLMMCSFRREMHLLWKYSPGENRDIVRPCVTKRRLRHHKWPRTGNHLAPASSEKITHHNTIFQAENVGLIGAITSYWGSLAGCDLQYQWLCVWKWQGHLLRSHSWTNDAFLNLNIQTLFLDDDSLPFLPLRQWNQFLFGVLRC